jgi:phage terminase large subunit-like protein
VSDAETARIRSGYRGYLAFCALIGADLAPFEKAIARAVFAEEREIVAVLPRGSAKSTNAARLAVHHVLSHPRPSVYVGAGSRDQARIIGRMVERIARHPALADSGLQIRHDELRTGLRETVLQVVPSEGGRAHGWERPTLMIGDEVWMWQEREPTLLGAMQTSLVKNPEAKLVVISTSASGLDSQLGRLRTRALALPVIERKGARLDCRGNGLRWLEWSLPEDESPDDPAAVKRCNPAPWVTKAALQLQRARVTEVEFLQFHCCRWGVGEGAWLPPGAWAACRGDCEAYGEDVWLGVDIGGSRAASAVIGVTQDLQVAEIHVLQGDDAVLRATGIVEEIAERRRIVECAYDPWRFQGEALRLEREHGLTMVEFPQSHARMTVASEGLHRVIVERKLTHPGDHDLDAHVHAAIAKKTGRGWRLDKLSRSDQIDGVVALAMAVERAQAPTPPRPRLLGFV